MKIYIDLFFLFNVIMDFIIITGVGIILKRRSNYIRILLSSLVGGVISLCLFTNINNILIDIIGIMIIVFISYGYKNIRYYINNIIYAYIISILIGGVIYLFQVKVTSDSIISYLIIIVIAIEVLVLYIKEMKKIKDNYNNYYKVNIYFKDKELKYNYLL